MSGPVRSVSQAFAILRLLHESPPLSLSDVGRTLELSPSSSLNLLKTLVAEGAVERDLRTKQFRLTEAWQSFEAFRDQAAGGLIERAKPLMARFAQSAEAVVGLWKMVSADRMQLVAHAECDAGMRLHLADAQRQPLGAGAAGRALAAAQNVDASELARRFATVRWQSDLSFETYARQVRDAKIAGYAIDEGFAHRGVCTVAAGISDVAPGFSLSVSIFAGTRREADVRSLGDELAHLRSQLAGEKHDSSSAAIAAVNQE